MERGHWAHLLPWTYQKYTYTRSTSHWNKLETSEKDSSTLKTGKGEIYRELRGGKRPQRLGDPCPWRGHSKRERHITDSEVSPEARGSNHMLGTPALRPDWKSALGPDSRKMSSPAGLKTSASRKSYRKPRVHLEERAHTCLFPGKWVWRLKLLRAWPVSRDCPSVSWCL